MSHKHDGDLPGEPEVCCDSNAHRAESDAIYMAASTECDSLIPPESVLADIVRYVAAWLSGSTDCQGAARYLEAHAAVVAQHLHDDMHAWTPERLGSPEVVYQDVVVIELPLLAIVSRAQSGWDRFRRAVWDAAERRRRS